MGASTALLGKRGNLSNVICRFGRQTRVTQALAYSRVHLTYHRSRVLDTDVTAVQNRLSC